MRRCAFTCVGPPGAAPVSADRGRRASSSGPAQSPAGPGEPAHSTALSGYTPPASKDKEDRGQEVETDRDK